MIVKIYAMQFGFAPKSGAKDVFLERLKINLFLGSVDLEKANDRARAQ